MSKTTTLRRFTASFKTKVCLPERWQELLRNTQLLDKYASIPLPGDPIRKAIDYTLVRWDKLILYAQSHHLDPDNKKVENSIRPVAIGRKNYLFAGSLHAA
jgi:hypothetical protein